MKLKNVPRIASQDSCSTNSVLNKDESLSVQNKVLANNNLDVNQSAEAEALLLKSEILWGECKPHKFKKWVPIHKGFMNNYVCQVCGKIKNENSHNPNWIYTRYS